jgi:t-SNARE complex subunit (syntaxin)
MEEKKKKKSPAGRKPLKEKKRKRYEYYLSDAEHSDVSARLQDSGYNQLGAFVRALILEENKSMRTINPVNFLNEVSSLSFQVSKIGNNINQLARHTHEMNKLKIIQPEVIQTINEKLEDYSVLQKKIISELKTLFK